MIARGVGAAVVLLAFAGCNAVFGLDAVTQVDGGEGTDAVAIDSAGDGPTGEPDAATPIDAGCGGDLDCDGIGDAVDRCPGVFDPAQHDEDGDGPGDACDNCPGVPNPTQADSTEPGVGADGVGDACDPHPQARDRLVLFDPMTEASAWVTSNSGARIVGGDLQVTGDTGGAVFAVRPNLPPSSGHTHVMVAFTIDQFAPGMVGSIDRGVSLYLGANGTTAAGRSCAWLAPNTRLTAPTLAGTDPSGAHRHRVARHRRHDHRHHHGPRRAPGRHRSRQRGRALLRARRQLGADLRDRRAQRRRLRQRHHRPGQPPHRAALSLGRGLRSSLATIRRGPDRS
jgi:hypothetical protein